MLVGEMRDYETINAAITAAETDILYYQHFIQEALHRQLSV
ncbi:MAG: hypothetical protein ACLS9K_00800 [Lachnospira eligens]